MQLRARSLALPGLLFGVVLCAAIYYRGLHGDFIFDDWSNIVQNSRLQTHDLTVDGLRAAALSSDSGQLKRPISMLSFWANYYTTGLDPFYFKLTNLLIHLLNGIGLFWLARLLLQTFDSKSDSLTPTARDQIALAVTLIWLVHPLNVTSVLYVVQRMTSLCATFTIFGLVSYVLGRQRLARGAAGFPLIFLGLFGFGALAVLSKENGVLLPLYMAAIELALFRFGGLEQAAAAKLKVFFALTVGVPLIAAVLFVAFDPAWLTQQYQTRPFTLTERALTEPRALWLYLTWLVAPTRASLGLFHDDVATSHGLLDPATTVVAIVALAAICATAIGLRRRAPLLAFAVCWFLAGHALESSLIGLELIHEHRNYLAIFGPLLAALCYLWRVSAGIPEKLRLAIPLVFLLAFSAVTFGRSSDWSDLTTLQLTLARDHPRSARSNYEAGTALGMLALRNPERAQDVYADARRFLERSAELDGTAVNPLFGLILLDATVHHPADEASIGRLAQRLSGMPLSFTVIEPFRSLIDWTTNRAVQLPEPLVATLFESALDNPTADRRTRAALLSIFSSYYHNVVGDLQNAVSLAMAAVEEDPAEPVHHIALADLAIRLENFELASREIAAAKRADSLGRMNERTQQLAEMLAGAAGKAETDSSALSTAPTNVASRPNEPRKSE